MKKWLRIVAVIMALSVLLSGCSGDTTEKEKPKTTRATQPSEPQTSDHNNIGSKASVDKRTVMIYIVGSDLESDGGAATEDIAEMITAQIDPAKVDVLLCAGGSKEWQNNVVSEAETSYYQVSQTDLVKVQQSGKKDMADSKTLSDFLNWSVSNYPADGFSLIFWDHGAGPMYGYGCDELTGGILSLEDMVTALRESPFNAQNKLELLGFDACLMGTAETAWAFKDYAEYFVGSQELEPGFGWDYEFLSKLSNCQNGADIGEEIIDYFYDYGSKYNSSWDLELTLSCIDLSKIDKVETAVNQLFSVVNQDVLSGQLATASRCRYRSKAFGKTDDGSYDLVDLKHMASLLSSSYSEAAALEQAVSEAVVYAKSNVQNAYGLSIYHPYDDLTSQSEMTRLYKTFDFAPKYCDYMYNFMTGMKNSTPSQNSYRNFSGTMGTAQASGGDYALSIQLTQEQLENFSSARYYVFWEIPAEETFSKKTEYLQVFSGQDVTLSDSGTLNATYGGKAVFGIDQTTGTVSDCPLSMNQIYDGSLEEKYYFPCMFWVTQGDFELEAVNWMMKIQDGVPVLQQAYRMNSAIENVPDKAYIDPEDYDLYTFANGSYFVATNENGNTEFSYADSNYGFEYTKEGGFSLELRPIPDKSEYRAVFLIEDIHGNQYYSDFIPLA